MKLKLREGIEGDIESWDSRRMSGYICMHTVFCTVIHNLDESDNDRPRPISSVQTFYRFDDTTEGDHMGIPALVHLASFWGLWKGEKLVEIGHN